MAANNFQEHHSGVLGSPLSNNSSGNTCDRPEARVEAQFSPEYYVGNASPSNSTAQQRLLQRTGKEVSCSSCRQRKIKCDRKSPCSRCVSAFHDCIYPESSRKRRRKPPSERIESLESRLKAMEASISARATALPVASSPMIAMAPNASAETVQAISNDDVASAEIGNRDTVYHVVDHDEIEFQGQSADRSFIQCLKAKLGDGPGDDMPRRQLPSYEFAPTFFELPDQSPERVPLPTKELAVRLVEAALDAQVLLCVIHRPSFDVSFSLVYSLNESDYSTKEKRFLPLLYAIFAYGSLFIDPRSEGLRRDEMVSQGLKFYAKSRQLQDIAECRDITSLQAIIFLNLFLLSSSRISTCYTYLSASLSIALRMGLHRSLKTERNLISHEISKRIFWTLRLLVNDVAACCGMPKLLSDEEIDQELPAEANDMYIEKNQIFAQPQTEICYISGVNAHNRLHMIRDKVTKYVYPIRGPNTTDTHDCPGHPVSLGSIRGIQEELDRWVKDIPNGYRLGTFYTEASLIRAQYILAMSYAHVQLYLYRPFLHYAVKIRKQQISPIEGILPYATASVRASENIIALCEEMYGRGLLDGEYWPVTRTLVSSIMTILCFVAACLASHEADLPLESLATGWKVLRHIAQHSYPANRGKVMLTVMISNFPKYLQDFRERFLELDGGVPNEDQNGSVEHNLRHLDDEHTLWLACKTFSSPLKPTADRPWPVSAAGDWGKGPGRNVNPSNELSTSQWTPGAYLSTFPRIHIPDQDLTDASNCSKSYGTPCDSNRRPTVVNNDSSISTPTRSQHHPQNQKMNSMGDTSQVIETQPLNFGQHCIDEAWTNTSNMGSINLSQNPQIFVTGPEDIGQYFGFESWL